MGQVDRGSLAAPAPVGRVGKAESEATMMTRAARGRFERDGFYFPVAVLSEEQALSYGRELERLEKRASNEKLGHKDQLNHVHVVFRFANELIRHPVILDAVEQILGPDILCWSSSVLAKEPHSATYADWHQDLRYLGLSGDEEVAVWLALTPATRAHGCMRLAPGSHRGALLEHRDTFDKQSLLTRGQVAAVDVDESRAVAVELEAGQASLHHGRLLHASGPNRTGQRRVGFVVNYVTPRMRQTIAERDYAVLVRGEDRYGHFETVPAPERDLAPEALAWHRTILDAQEQALYDAADNARPKR